MNNQEEKENYENVEAANMTDIESAKLEAAKHCLSDIEEFHKQPETNDVELERAVKYIMKHDFAILMPKYDGIYAKITYGSKCEIVQVLDKYNHDITEWFLKCASFKGDIPNSTITAEMLPSAWELTKADLETALYAGDKIDIIVYPHLNERHHKLVLSRFGREYVEKTLLSIGTIEELRTDGAVIYIDKEPPFCFTFLRFRRCGKQLLTNDHQAFISWY